VLALLCAGCGYTLVRTGGSLGEVRSVAIPTPRNDTYEAGAEYIVADALRREFLRRQGVHLVDDPASADLVLTGSVRQIATRATSVDSIVLALEYELTLELELEARRRDGVLVPLDVSALRDTERYLVSADSEAARKNRLEALRLLSSVLAGRVYLALHETLEP
jgi:outer membrane lipopolysaccharide assembly protein LptE/RlpB